jgi:hypothetical protein
MSTDLSRHSLLEELDARQTAVLDELEQLNCRIEQLIAEASAWRGSETASPQLAAAA